MGTWDVGSFGNDGAVDWTYGLEESDDLSYVEDALDAAADVAPSAAVPVDACENAVAAADVVARLLGKWGARDSYSNTADTWVESHPKLKPTEPLVKKARVALDRIVTMPSELLELWEEAGDAEGWIESVNEVRSRLP
jgi:hypothetical protein